MRTFTSRKAPPFNPYTPKSNCSRWHYKSSHLHNVSVLCMAAGQCRRQRVVDLMSSPQAETFYLV